MQIVIDIPEEIYNDCKTQVEMMRQEGLLIQSLNTSLKIIIVNGTPLPKVHGRLIDVDEAYDNIVKEREKDGVDMVHAVVRGLSNTTTIMEGEGQYEYSD